MATHTHVVTLFANPYLVCDECQEPVEGYLDVKNQPPECSHIGKNVPCRHKAGVSSTCPSWSPVNGCHCEGVWGYVPHVMMEENHD